MPARRIEKAMTKRVKLVTMIRMPGATERMVSRPNIWMIQPATEPSTGTFNKIRRQLLRHRQFRNRHHGGKDKTTKRIIR